MQQINTLHSFLMPKQALRTVTAMFKVLIMLQSEICEGKQQQNNLTRRQI